MITVFSAIYAYITYGPSYLLRFACNTLYLFSDRVGMALGIILPITGIITLLTLFLVMFVDIEELNDKERSLL